MTVAVRVTVSPAFKEAVVLFRVTEVTGVATTVTVQVAVLSPALAVMVAEPTFLAVTTPSLTVATEASDVLQVTVLSVASSGLTVAERVTVSPAFREALVLSRVTLVTGVATTVTAQVAALSPALAVMVAEPTFLAVTTPLLTVATEASEVVQVTVLSVASSGLTVAERVTLSPAFKERLSASSVTSSISIGVTFTTHMSDLSPQAAVMLAWPTLRVVTTPSLTLATDSSEEDHTILLFVVFSGKTVAKRWSVCPNGTLILV